MRLSRLGSGEMSQRHHHSELGDLARPGWEGRGCWWVSPLVSLGAALQLQMVSREEKRARNEMSSQETDHTDSSGTL